MTTPRPLLRIAAAQFPVSGDLRRNARAIESQMVAAAGRGVNVIQFPETALPGYGPKHIESMDDFAWDALDAHTKAIRELAASLDLWVVLGSMQRVANGLPRNCLHVISSAGALVGTYDKQRLYGQERALYSPGTGPLVVTINGFKCGFLICYDNCFPELYAAYRQLGVGLVFHSFYNAGNAAPTSIEALMLATVIVRAADNQMWISASNSSRRYSPLSACVVRPDGSMVRRKRHCSGFAVDDYPQATLGWTYDNRAT